MGLVNLGDIVFEGFEVPSSLNFGGKQRVVIHKLIGGARVVDAMGRDDAALHWRGILSGAQAADRARTLDAVRAAGTLQMLTWDAFCYSVIISDLRLSFRSPCWIHYEIVCTVQQDLAYSVPIYDTTIVNSVVDDLAEVSRFLGSADTLGAQSISSSLLAGPVGYREALRSTAQLQITLEQGIETAENSLAATDVRTLVSAAGSLAQLCCAQGYLDRSVSTIASVSL